VPQISDPDYQRRPVFREADLRRHLSNEGALNERQIEDDGVAADPRFSQTAEQLRAAGIEDFQLHYALQTMARLARSPQLAESLRLPNNPAAPAAPTRRNNR
jgi:carboxyl-terminal processing protease